jgi:hypothetical protein
MTAIERAPRIDITKCSPEYLRPFESCVAGGDCGHDAELIGGAPDGIDILARRVAPNSDASSEERATALAAYRHYIDSSCDLTMRGGTTSGVIYPLAVCALAKRYVFRSVGGASAGAIAAAASAAAELGRCAEPAAGLDDQERVAGAVDPGFDGLRQIVDWLTEKSTVDQDIGKAQQWGWLSCSSPVRVPGHYFVW